MMLKYLEDWESHPSIEQGRRPLSVCHSLSILRQNSVWQLHVVGMAGEQGQSRGLMGCYKEPGEYRRNQTMKDFGFYS